jgi:hypothetical protein
MQNVWRFVDDEVLRERLKDGMPLNSLTGVPVLQSRGSLSELS